jgi:hypothetical protein
MPSGCKRRLARLAAPVASDFSFVTKQLAMLRLLIAIGNGGTYETAMKA